MARGPSLSSPKKEIIMKNKKVHFIDCGANVGIAIDWAKEKYKENLIKVDAFEPEIQNYDVLLSKCYKEKNII